MDAAVAGTFSGPLAGPYATSTAATSSSYRFRDPRVPLADSFDPIDAKRIDASYVTETAPPARLP